VPSTPSTYSRVEYLTKREKGTRRTPKKNPARFRSGAPFSEADQRRAYRIPVSLSLRFSGRQRFGKTGAGLSSDLSETGYCVQSRYPLKIGTSLALVAELPHPVLITEARVVWVTGRRSGLEFLRVSPTERTRLRHFLWRHISRAMVSDHPPLFTLVSSSHQNRTRLKAIF
jgi:hypothetical protein